MHASGDCNARNWRLPVHRISCAYLYMCAIVQAFEELAQEQPAAAAQPAGEQQPGGDAAAAATEGEGVQVKVEGEGVPVKVEGEPAKKGNIDDLLAAEVAQLKDKKKDRFKWHDTGVRGSFFLIFPYNEPGASQRAWRAGAGCAQAAAQLLLWIPP